MPYYEDTGEFLAVKYPHIAHVIPELEKQCSGVELCGDGWGTLTMQMKGIDEQKKLIIPVIDVLIRYFRKDKTPARKNNRIAS